MEEALGMEDALGMEPDMSPLDMEDALWVIYGLAAVVVIM
jgi:hypothetical protein